MKGDHHSILALVIICLILGLCAGGSIQNLLNGITAGDIQNLKNIARSFDGFNNNQQRPTWGMVNQPYQRTLSTSYKDGISIPDDGPNARDLSNILGSIADEPL